MTALREPPTTDKPSRIVTRILVLIVLVLVAGVLIWTSATSQQIDQVEDRSIEDLDLEDVASVDGVQINVVTGEGGVIPVVLLHDRDVTGSSLWDSVTAGVGGRFKPVRIDLPGYGLSTRIPAESALHTVASLAEVVTTVIEERYDLPVVVVGVGLGGKIAAEIAVTSPDIVRGLVMIDVDFWPRQTWELFVQRLPLVGEPATFTLEAGGALGVDRWAPNCAEGGWCPSASQMAARTLATQIIGTTASLNSSHMTPASALVPSDLDLIEVPVVYLWSTEGVVPRRSVDRAVAEIPGVVVSEVPVWKAHLEQPMAVVDAIDLVGR
jgi:pimeloyl-ACP methyl ester carboxylesterase